MSISVQTSGKFSITVLQLKISTDVVNDVWVQYVADGIVCLANLQLGLLTVAAVDNIDHNPSSATAQHFFHGTSMTLI